MRRRVLLLYLGTLAGCFGAPVEPTGSCDRYVQCLQGLDAAAGTTTNLDRYLEGGACWRNATLAEMCDTSCRRALERMGELDARRVAECAP